MSVTLTALMLGASIISATVRCRMSRAVLGDRDLRHQGDHARLVFEAAALARLDLRGMFLDHEEREDRDQKDFEERSARQSIVRELCVVSTLDAEEAAFQVVN